MALGVLLLVVALVLGVLSLSNGLELRAFEQHSSDKSTDALDTTMVAQSFRSTRDNLSRIDLEASSFAALPASGRFSLLQGDGPDGTPVYQGSLSAGSFADNPFLEFRFPPIAGSEDVTYTLVLSTPGEPLKRFVGLRYNSFDALSSGKMYTDAGATRGDLAITTYYRYGLADALGDAGSALTGGLFSILAWALLLMLPGLALLVWLPSSLSAGQRVLAAPGVSLLALPIFFLITRSLGLPMSGGPMWLLLGLCLALVVAAVVRRREQLKMPRPDCGERGLLVAAGGGVRPHAVHKDALSARPASRTRPRRLPPHADCPDVCRARRHSDLTTSRTPPFRPSLTTSASTR